MLFLGIHFGLGSVGKVYLIQEMERVCSIDIIKDYLHKHGNYELRMYRSKSWTMGTINLT